jgi:hypothetical protein
MDFRPLDQMSGTDEALIEYPFKPFYNIFSIKPVIVKQYASCNVASKGRI